MNKELIQKFYEQSLVKRNTEWGDNITFFDFNKFAELIVNECISINNEFGEDVENGNILNSSEHQLGTDITNGHLGMILWRSSEKIKEHFGIE